MRTNHFLLSLGSNEHFDSDELPGLMSVSVSLSTIMLPHLTPSLTMLAKIECSKHTPKKCILEDWNAKSHLHLHCSTRSVRVTPDCHQDSAVCWPWFAIQLLTFCTSESDSPNQGAQREDRFRWLAMGNPRKHPKHQATTVNCTLNKKKLWRGFSLH